MRNARSPYRNILAGHLVVALATLCMSPVAVAHAVANGHRDAKVTTFAAGDMAEALMSTMPTWHWLANGDLGWVERVDGKPQMHALDPQTGRAAVAAQLPHIPEPRVVAPGIFSYSPPTREVPSPDGAWFAGTRDGNLYVRPASGEGAEVALTRDGTPGDHYEVLGARWSPDGRDLALRRMDEDKVPTIPLVDWSAADQPVTRWLYSRVGDPLVRQTLVIADRRTGKVSTIHLDPAFAYLHPVSWSPDSRYLYLMATTRLMKQLDLIRVDATDGSMTTLLSEHTPTHIDGSQSYLFVRGYAPELTDLHYVTMLPDGRFVWTSERDGWRRLYLYSRDGKPVRALTPPLTEVQRVVAYDARHDMLYYVAQADRDRPYLDALFGVSLADGASRRIAYGPAFGQIRMRGDGQYFALLHGGLQAAPTLDIYGRDGHRVRTVWSAQAVLGHFRQGAVEPFIVKAADGRTPIHGLIFKPAHFDAGKRYPVVESAYGGPQDYGVAHWQADHNYWVGQALASDGFIAVEIDGRGTPGRGLDFANTFYGRIGQGEIADHVAALRQIARTRPWMDMGRVGVFGHSWGGYFATRALLQAPEVYKVAVDSAGPATLRDFRAGMQIYMGCVPQKCPDAYARGSNTALVVHMRGELLIMHGTVDRDVPFGESMRLINALEKAGKSYQFVAFPGKPHTIYMVPYWWRRAVQFLDRTLGEAQTEPMKKGTESPPG
ncbi:MAG: DPP IV N-terminal domain-containing protein [Xanthomonadaceae bacterium]|nr:DPP IV N-terminal domain-containing protein [Xanthomonadaceae bacterium]